MSSIFDRPKSRKLAIILALLGTISPVVGLHKFYLRQPVWGVMYFLLLSNPLIPRIACAVDMILYLLQGEEEFNRRFNSSFSLSSSSVTPLPTLVTSSVKPIAEGLRELDQLREEGLISEYEFEQKRRKLLDHL